MIELMRSGMRVTFLPPENAYSRKSIQYCISGYHGILKEWNGIQAMVYFDLKNGQFISIHVNPDYLFEHSE